MDKKRQVLIVDDDSSALVMLQLVMENAGYNVVGSASHGEQAIELAKALRPDLILMDVSMPGMNGMEATRLIMEESPTPIVMMTAHQEVKIVDGCAAAGACGYLIKPASVEDVRRAAEMAIARFRDLKEMRRLNAELQEKIAEHARIVEELRFRNLLLTTQQEVSPDGILVVNAEGRIVSITRRFVEMWGIPREIVESASDERALNFVLDKLVEPERFLDQIKELYIHKSAISRDEIALKDGRTFDRYSAIMTGETDKYFGRVWYFRDISEQKKAEANRREMESHFAHAQKMESIGQLAAGIAHEINTPTQFIGDHTRFVKDSFGGLTSLIQAYDRVFQEAKAAGSVPPETVADVEAAKGAADLEYVMDRVPKALDQVLDGVTRVATIVRAMKDFSHPGQVEKTPVDLNKCIESTATVARNEWKYVADLELDLDKSLPFVNCLPGEINQAILNIIVNAAHAIADMQKASGTDRKGRITIRTRREKDWAEIRISDTGTGIPEKIQPRVFDPFFTTKEVGRGTGQGLSIAYQEVTKTHGGSIRFDTTEGKGTTFIIRLPIGTSETN